MLGRGGAGDRWMWDEKWFTDLLVGWLLNVPDTDKLYFRSAQLIMPAATMR